MDSTLKKPTNDSSPANIEQDIVETRTRISKDIENLGQKMSPENIAENAKDVLDEAKEAVVDTVQEWTQTMTEGAGDWTGTIANVIKRNPLATTLIGVGIGLLAAGSVRAAQNTDDDYDERDYNANYMAGRRYDPQFIGGYPSSTPQSSGRIIHTASGGAGATTADDVVVSPNTVEGYSPSLQTQQSGNPIYNSRGDVYNPGDYNSGSSDSLEQMRHQARRVRRKAKTGFAAWFDENPLMVGAVTAAVGLGLGLTLPSSSYEDELMGETSDSLLAQAKHTAINAAEVVKETAKETASTVQGEVQSKLDDINIKETIKEKAKAAEDAVEDITNSAKQTAQDKAKLEADKRNLNI